MLSGRLFRILLASALLSGLQACAVVSLGATVAGTAVSVAGTVVSTAVTTTGKVIGAAADAVAKD